MHRDVLDGVSKRRIHTFLKSRACQRRMGDSSAFLLDDVKNRCPAASGTELVVAITASGLRSSTQASRSRFPLITFPIPLPPSFTRQQHVVLTFASGQHCPTPLHSLPSATHNRPLHLRPADSAYRVQGWLLLDAPHARTIDTLRDVYATHAPEI